MADETPLSPTAQPQPQPQPQQRGQRRPTTIDDLPHDLLVSIFSQIGIEHTRWLRQTFPRVCREWRDLYRTRQASPLHKSIFLNLQRDSPPSVLAYARRRAADVRTLCVQRVPGDARIRYFNARTFSRLVSVLGPNLEELVIGSGCGSLLRNSFWAAALRNVVAVGRLERLSIHGIRSPVPESISQSLGRLTNLDSLILHCDDEGRRAAARNAAGTSWGFSGGFPDSLLALTRLKVLCLQNHRGIVAIPSRISNLRNLEWLGVADCSLRALPPQLGMLTKLTTLRVRGNARLGAVPEDEAFPAALSGMTSLRALYLSSCGLREIPTFVEEFEALEKLFLNVNLWLGGFPASFPVRPALTCLDLTNCGFMFVPVLSSFPGLKELRLGKNDLRYLPRDLGQRLPLLAKIELSGNSLSAVPVAELAGATSLEELALSKNESLQVEGPLDRLLENHPRLRLVTMGKRRGTWTNTSSRNLMAFATKLRTRDRKAPAALLATPSA